MMRKGIRKRTTARLFVIVGNESSGKDDIIRAVLDLGVLHAQAVPKYTSRPRKDDDGSEMVCDCEFTHKSDNMYYVSAPETEFDPVFCEITYERNQNQYGICCKKIWAGLQEGLFQVIVVSDPEPINALKRKFGGLVVLLFAYSPGTKADGDELNMFSRNLDKFDHVLIHEDKKEDLFDQLFRLFRAYET